MAVTLADNGRLTFPYNDIPLAARFSLVRSETDSLADNPCFNTLVAASVEPTIAENEVVEH